MIQPDDTLSIPISFKDITLICSVADVILSFSQSLVAIEACSSGVPPLNQATHIRFDNIH